MAEGRAVAYAAAAVVLWSTVATAFKLALRHAGPLTLLAWSSLFSLGAVAAVVASTGGLGRLRAMTHRESLSCAALGILNPTIYYAILFYAYDRLPAQIAQPLNYTWAFALAVVAVPVLGQPFRARSVPAFLLGLAGVTLLTYAGKHLDPDPLGVALALSSAVIWALYWALLTRSPIPPELKLFWAFAAGTGLTFPLAFVSGDPVLPPWQGVAGAFYVGVFEMGLTFFLWSKALSLAREAANVAIWIYAAPFLSLVLIHLVLGEQIIWTTPIGLALIVTGILVQTYGGSILHWRSGRKPAGATGHERKGPGGTGLVPPTRTER